MANRLIAYTQYRENYGENYWKNKGGSEYLVAVLTTEQAQVLGEEGLKSLVDEASNEFCYADEGSEEYLLGWHLYADGETTHDEDIGIGSPTFGPWTRREA